MRLSYEPVAAGGGAVSTVLAILVYYGVLDVKGAGLWGTLAVIVLPSVSAGVVRFFTMAKKKIEDAGHRPEDITAQAARNRGTA